MSKEIKHLQYAFEVKASDIREDGTFLGYGSIFGNVDSYDDVVAPGAYAMSIADFSKGSARLPMLWQHNTSQPIGIFPTLKEDSRGLYLEGAINLDVQAGREAYALLKQGAISGLSIGYRPVTSEYRDDGIRILKEVKLYEISLVTFPANDEARVTGVKCDSVKTIRDLETLLREAAGLSRNNAKLIASRFRPKEGDERDAAKSDEAKQLGAIGSKLDQLISQLAVGTSCQKTYQLSQKN